MSIYDQDKSMDDSHYNETKTKKTQIILHHTAGGPNPLNVISGWKSTTTKIGAHSVIGGTGDFDGKIIKAVDSDFWLWGLGIKNDPTNKPHGYYDKKAVQIEVCNWGGLKPVGSDFVTYVNTKVPRAQVVDLGGEYRGFRYYHAYTDAQLAALEKLIRYYCGVHDIVLEKGRVFTIQDFATDIKLFGEKPLAFHVNYRSDKNDMAPQPKLLAMLNRLHA